ncbi:MAG: hypothetical protein ACXVCE_16210, partial [Bacteriovorax sp.]
KFDIINFMVAKDESKIDLVNIDYIAGEMDYELRKSDGNPIEDQKDPSNSYWKKETKCYNFTDANDKASLKRTCKTSYKEFYYEEKDAI